MDPGLRRDDKLGGQQAFLSVTARIEIDPRLRRDDVFKGG